MNYTYDVHGNVEGLSQQIQGVPTFDIFYDYDLISGNVHEVSFNPGSSDQYFHRYTYDADNRLQCVYSSSDQLIWEEDARYFYYQHGPLARVELGEDKVQGCDYYYTLQGWIKGMNMANGSGIRNEDLGKDASTGQGELNKLIAEDAFAYQLGYNKNDYKPIGGVLSGALPGNAMTTAWTNLYSPNDDGLFNGNIALSIYDNPSNPGGLGRLHGHSYRYDQLHRILQDNSKFFLGTNWISPGVNSYSSNYSYDKNGNLLTLNRWLPQGSTGQQFDQLDYVFEPNYPNRLRRVDDGIANNIKLDDIDDQSGSNYLYDEIGQLINDASEGQTITWDVYGKVRTLNNGLQTVEYRYDGMGNRVYKKTIPVVGDETLTLYVRDAQGNILSIYESSTGQPLVQKEAILYGSSRLGTHSRGVVANQSAPTTDFSYSKDKKGYELNDHKSSVYSVVSDLKFYDGIRYSATQKSYADLYPGGWEIKERSLSTANNTFGYEGQLKDDAWSGDASTSIEFAARTMDTRIIRMRSVDPLWREYPGFSPYSVGMNRLIDGKELEGMEYLDAEESYYNISLGQTWLQPKGVNLAYGKLHQLSGGTDLRGRPYLGRTIPVQRVDYIVEGRTLPMYNGRMLKGLMFVNNRMSEIFEMSRVTKSTGKLDKRYTVTRHFNTMSGNTKIVGGVGLTIAAIDLADQVNIFLKRYEQGAQQQYVRESWNTIRSALKAGVIPMEFQNIEELSKIADFVLRGADIGNDDLQKVAVGISKNIAKNYRYPLKAIEQPSGLDNYPTKVDHVEDIEETNDEEP